MGLALALMYATPARGISGLDGQRPVQVIGGLGHNAGAR